MERTGQINQITKSGKLFQQFVLDGYCQIEGDRTQFLKANQKTLRAEHYVGIQDYIARKTAKRNEKAGSYITQYIHSWTKIYPAKLSRFNGHCSRIWKTFPIHHLHL